MNERAWAGHAGPSRTRIGDMEYLTGDLGAGGAARCAAEFRFQGRLGEPFVTFAIRRADRLSLSGWVHRSETDIVTVAAEGPQALVDAFEIACSLGPIDSDVESWTRSERAAGANAQTFERRP